MIREMRKCIMVKIWEVKNVKSKLDESKGKFINFVGKGPSIYDSPHGGGGGQAQVDACGQGRGGPAPCGRPHRKLKLESTDIILSSHAKELASFLPEFRLWTEK